MSYEQLTPRTIALAHLVNLFATHHELPLASRQELALILMEQLTGSAGTDSVIEQGLHQLRGALATMPPSFLDTFDGLLLATTTPDDLWTLMASLHELVTSEPSALCDVACHACTPPMFSPTASVR